MRTDWDFHVSILDKVVEKLQSGENRKKAEQWKRILLAYQYNQQEDENIARRKSLEQTSDLPLDIV